MKRFFNYMMLSVWILLSVCCSDEELVSSQPLGQSGDDVLFGLSLPGASSRTTYGAEDNGVFPIYWTDGDKVQVFSPQCLAGRRSAEYKVILPTDTDKPDYADNLVKTKDFGVQWGNAEKAVFYSLYPSGNYTLSSDGTKAENITISYRQNIVVNADGTVKSDMQDCLMYAKNDGGKDNNYEGVPRGAVVNLQYEPISTVVYVTLEVAENTDATADYFTIQSVKLIAPEGTDIVGTFSLKIADGSFVEFAKDAASNELLAEIANPSTGGYHKMTNKEKISVPLFFAPRPNLNVKDWKIQVVANNVTYTKTLGIDKTLSPGQIHKISLPKLQPSTTEWSVSNWMVNIPRNVYLSEVSIPGSWNTLNGDYQNDKTISGQYAIGVRGFHFDTRWRTSDTSVGITGNLGGSINALSVAGGADSGKLNGGDRVVSGNAKTFAEYLKQITDNIVDESGNPKPEYMVLMCTFAQDSYNYTDSNGKNWVDAISDACASNNYVYDAKNLTSNTVVGEVIGKVIVIVNMEGSFTALPNNSKCLFVNMPLTLNSGLFGSTLNDNNKGQVYKTVANNTTVVESGIEMYHTQAQISLEGESYTGSQDRNNVMDRGFAPTAGERKTVANNILKWSKDNYGTDNYQHDKWIYLGLGGYYATWGRTLDNWSNHWYESSGSNVTVASYFNSWINSKVTEMGTTVTTNGETTTIPFYPVGINLMNFVTDYKSVVGNILLLNNKYRLQYDVTKPNDYNPNAQAKSAYQGSSLENGGNAITTK